MDELLKETIEGHTPKFNKRVVEGVAYHQMRNGGSLEYLREVARSGFQTLHKCLRFIDIEP